MTKLFESTDYIRQPHDVTVDGLTAEMAAWLTKQPAFRTLRYSARGTHPAVSAYLTAVTQVGQAWRSHQARTPLTNTGEQASESRSWVTSSEAADLLGIGPRAVQLAIARGRLQATRLRPGSPWRIEREDVRHYEASRAA